MASSRNQWIAILTAIIAAIGAIVVAFINRPQSPENSRQRYTGIVTDAEKRPVADAKVTLLTQGPPSITFTDVDGVYVLTIPQVSGSSETRLRVEKDDFQTYLQNLPDNSHDRIEDIRLVPKSSPSEPLIDSQGHPLETPANAAEREVIRIQDEIMALREFKESVQQPGSRRRLQVAPVLAENILKFNDADLTARRRFIKYEFAAYAYVDAAAAAMFDDREQVNAYASKAITNGNKALFVLASAEQTYRSSKDSRILVDWTEHQGKDRVLYLLADADCMIGTVKNDERQKSKAFETWKTISSSYRADLPATGTLQLAGCVPADRSN